MTTTEPPPAPAFTSAAAWVPSFVLDLAAPPGALDPNRDLRIELPLEPALAAA